MTFELIVGVAGGLVLLALGGLAVLLLVRGRGRARSPDLSMTLDEIQTQLSCRDGSLDARVSELNTKLASLQASVTARESSLDEQVRGIGAQMQGIAGLFTNDRARGGWGEVSLLRVFELGGLVESQDFTSHFHSGNGTPDALVHLPGGRSLVIDSKFPVVRYNEALATDDVDERNRLLVAQGKELERVGKSLVDKGYDELASGGYVVMYLPSQAVYEASAAVSHDVIERLLEKRVLVAGPTALFALIMNVSALLTEHRGLQQADQILEEARELNRRMTTFIAHLSDIGSALGKTVGAFNGAVGSWTSRVAPQLSRVNELNGGDEADILEPIDEAVRPIEPTAYALLVDPTRN